MLPSIFPAVIVLALFSTQILITSVQSQETDFSDFIKFQDPDGLILYCWSDESKDFYGDVQWQNKNGAKFANCNTLTSSEKVYSDDGGSTAIHFEGKPFANQNAQTVKGRLKSVTIEYRFAGLTKVKGYNLGCNENDKGWWPVEWYVFDENGYELDHIIRCKVKLTRSHAQM